MAAAEPPGRRRRLRIPVRAAGAAGQAETARTAAAGERTRLGRLAFVEWEEAPRRGLLNRGLFPTLSLLGYETPEKVDGCHGVMYAPPAVKEVYFRERVHTSNIPSA